VDISPELAPKLTILIVDLDFTETTESPVFLLTNIDHSEKKASLERIEKSKSKQETERQILTSEFDRKLIAKSSKSIFFSKKRKML
jgi:ribonucleotide monophosphatase NagD (HAD superfamily)